MKITRRQLKQIIKEALMIESSDGIDITPGTDIDLDLDADADFDPAYYSQASGGRYKSTLPDAYIDRALTNVRGMSSMTFPGSHDGFVSGLASFGIENLRGNLLALVHAWPAYAQENNIGQRATQAYFIEDLRDAITWADKRERARNNTNPNFQRYKDIAPNIIGLLNTILRLGQVTRETGL